MKRRYILIIWSILLTLLPLLNGCIREEEFDNTPQGNFEALWKIIDEQYCFLDYKQIDWDAIHDKYQPLITPGMSYDGLLCRHPCRHRQEIVLVPSGQRG